MFLKRRKAPAQARAAGEGESPGGIPRELLDRVKFIEIKARRLVNDLFLGKEATGQELNEQFLKDLPAGIDPCGENGEFHTFCFAGPLGYLEHNLYGAQVPPRHFSKSWLSSMPVPFSFPVIGSIV